MENSEVQDLSQNAIKAAISKNWQEAVEINKSILDISADDIPTLNRLGIAYSMINKPRKASITFNKVLKLEPKNQIAKNNLSRLKTVKKNGLVNLNTKTINFVEEPGKSKIVPLVSIGEPSTISLLNVGEEVIISPNKHKIKIATVDDKFIGYLPDNISHRLFQLLRSGYKYKCFMKSVVTKNPSVFILETHASKRYHGLPSFPLDENETLPNLSGGESSETPPLQIYDPDLESED